MIKKSEVAGFLAFFKFPKPFIYDEKYKKLSNNAKLMYMLLFGRLELSIKNGWHDRKGNVFQYYTNEQLMIDLNSSEKTIIKVKKELREVGLLEEVRQGNNLPNRIYISQVDGAVENTVLEL
ncbi:replication initiator protein A, partial [Streptococcus sp. HMSC072G04]|uniref:replication initiator protein A n=1 Tax=Streptococcus sp. HMSC072G04 TaxID=1739408 RepID=UPI000A757E15